MRFSCGVLGKCSFSCELFMSGFHLSFWGSCSFSCEGEGADEVIFLVCPKYCLAMANIHCHCLLCLATIRCLAPGGEPFFCVNADQLGSKQKNVLGANRNIIFRPHYAC